MTTSILITGRRWFDPSGNTYFSANGYVDGELVANIAYEYGYGDHYIQAMTDKLEELGYMPDRKHYEHGGAEPAWQYFRDNRGITFNYEVSDVARKKDL
jgi:hypothetical protein